MDVLKNYEFKKNESSVTFSQYILDRNYSVYAGSEFPIDVSIEIKKKEPFFTIKILEGFRTEFSEPALVLYNEIKQALINEFGEDKLVEDS